MSAPATFAEIALPRPSSPAPLPTGYLLRNFQQVLEWVSNLYSDLLTPAEHEFYLRFYQLPEPARHLYLRLLTRKGPYIPVQSLQYEEVPDTALALDALVQAKFALLNPEADSSLLLNRMNKAGLRALFDTAIPASAGKAELIKAIVDQHSAEHIRQAVAAFQPYAQACHADIFSTFLLLFFGNGRQDLSEFVISDLGHVRYENYRVCSRTRYFNSRREIEILQQYLETRDRLENVELLADADALIMLFAQLPFHENRPELIRRFEKIAIPIARQLERLQQDEKALGIYRQCESHPSHERQARILAKQGQVEDALQLCRTILQTSRHPEAVEFAWKFGATLARKHQRTFPAETPFQLNEFSLQTPNTGDPVELIAATLLSDEEHDCYYVENVLFCGLFGLYFWDIVFAPVTGAFFNPFQRGPKHLNSEFFYRDRVDLIDARLQRMNQEDWSHLLWQHFHQKQGIANPFVFWEALREELIALTLEKIPVRHLQVIFRQLASHPGFYASGFPDLIRFSSGGYELIEVKGPGDRLQPNQRRWFRRFHNAGIQARLVNVSWTD